jgi:hypothetical protein
MKPSYPLLVCVYVCTWVTHLRRWLPSCCLPCYVWSSNCRFCCDVMSSKEWKYVVASIYKCEGLPVMDGKVGMGIATVKQGE